MWLLLAAAAAALLPAAPPIAGACRAAGHACAPLPPPPPLSRRRALSAAAAGVSGVFGALGGAGAYDEIPQVSGEFAELEKLRLERTAAIKQNKAKYKPLLDDIANVETEKEFADTTERLILAIIKDGRVPEGVEATRIRDVIVDAYKELPLTLKWTNKQKPPPGLGKCEVTRTNNGVCFSPGALAEGSLNSSLRELRKYAKTRDGRTAGAGKGALISDGISAANNAAF